MKTVLIGIVAGVTSLIGAGSAAAAPPAWCKGATPKPADLSGLSTQDPKEVIRTFVGVECAPSAEATEHRAEIETARAAWSKRLGMTEADWADAVAYADTDDYSIELKVATKTLATASPLDQYAFILNTATNTSAKIDTMYATDMFEGRLSEAGRFAFLRTTCLDDQKDVARAVPEVSGAEPYWAICQPDFERFDLAKLLAEIHADTTHDGAVKMKVRLSTYNFPKYMKEHAVEVKQALAYDDANKKLFEVAAKARTEWSSGVGKNTKLLDLVLAMESADFTQSRKQREGCAETTAAALAEAVATIPAKAFAGTHEAGNNPTKGFATRAGVALTQSPTVGLAAIAFVLCDATSGNAKFLSKVLQFTPGVRGPRNAAIGQIASAKITYDNAKATLDPVTPKPYGDRYPTDTFEGTSEGAVIKSVKRNGDTLSVEAVKTTETSEECLAEHTSNRVERVRDNGAVVYANVCDKSGKVTRDITRIPLELAAKYEPWLKPGMVYAATGGDLLAVWPNKAAKVPSMVLGAKLK